ncbi:hypothetical protein [Mucilaginibacter sp.]|uniref:RNA recognition motif domain-containing protein n=1 Tax=Mucilaginibacter sp. TaxID=1882438 RepID=UPI00326629E5
MAKLFIVGFPRDMEEIELVEIFSIHGIVNTVTIVTDQSSGESKGYGFIMMADQAGAERAIAALDGGEIDGRTISVRFAEDKSAPILNPLQKNPHKIQPGNQNTPQTAPRKKRPRRPM